MLAGRPADRHLALAIVLGTIPAGLAGLLFERAIETRLRSAAVVAVFMIGWALVLWWADRQASRGRSTRSARSAWGAPS